MSNRKALVEKLEQRRLFATISGNVFYDLNGNGIKDAGENGASNNTQTVFIDDNNDGVINGGEVSTTIDAFGNYSFNVLPGTYHVRLIPDAGYVRTAPVNEPVAITVGPSDDATGPTFGVTQAASISGIAYNDANGNGTQDIGEPVLPRAIAFIDQNGNGKADSSSAGFSSTDVPKTAVGMSTVASTISVKKLTGLVTDVNVSINLTSPNDNDPDIFLENPQGIRVELVSPIDTVDQSDGSNFTKTTLDDQAGKSIAQGAAPFTGSFQTSGHLVGNGLDKFNNLSPNGTWRLIVANTADPNTARLKNWSLQITSGDPQAKAGGNGRYNFNLWPGTYHLGAAKKNFIVTQPGGKAHQASVTLNSTDARQDVNFGLQEIGTDNNTVKFSSAANLVKDTSDSPFGVVTGDFNKDGKMDVASVNNGSNDVAIYLGNGHGRFLEPVFYNVGDAPRGIAVGDFNHDGNIDLVAANHDGDDVSVLIGKGDGTFKPQTTFAADLGTWSVAVGDFNSDGKQDLIVANNSVPTVDLLLGNGKGSFNAAIPITAPLHPKSIKAADVNRDGKLDFVVTSDMNNSVSIFLGNGKGGFKSPNTILVGHGPASVNIADLNNDGKLDLIVANADDNDIAVLIGKGTGSFLAPVDYPAGDTPASVDVGDLNGDGKIDVIVSNRSDGGTPISGNVMVFLGNGDGTLQPAFSFTAHTSPVAAAVGDFNRDGKLDLAVGNFNSDDVSVLINQTIPI